MSNLTTLPKGDSAWLFRKAIERIIQQISDLETNIGSSTTGNSANTQIIFNDNGVLRGDPDLTFNTALNKLVATALESTTSLVVGTSATITGDLTVKTNVLKVDSTNNRVGVGTASPALPLEIYKASGDSKMRITSGANSLTIGWDDPNGFYYTANTSLMAWQLSGSTAMTLNSTGLGVGVASPSFKLQVVGTSGSLVDFCGSGVAGLQTLVRLRTATGNTNGLLIQGNVSNDEMYINNFYNAALSFGTNNTERLRIDSSGNVGIGVTPSAWNTAYAVAQVGIGGSIWSLKSTYYDQFGLGCNHFENTSGSDRYVNNGRASQYFQYQGTHIFRIAGNNTLGAGAALTWTPVMTLDASGNLILLSSNTPATLTTNGQLTVNATSNTNLRFSYRGSDGVTRVANITLA